MLRETIAFVNTHPDCFERTLLVGHITGSAWIVDEGQQYTLLVHHRKLDRWFQPGGHCDGEPDVLKVAVKEAEEETGLIVRPLDDKIFDVDVHLIPERKNVPAHFHYDIRFLLVAAKHQPLVISEESKDLAWVKMGEVTAYNDSDSVVRMATKLLS